MQSTKKQTGFTLIELLFAIILVFVFGAWCVNLYILITTNYPTLDAIEPWARVFFAVLPILIILRS